MKCFHLGFTLGALSLCFVVPAHTQPCLSAKPRPHCGAFFITELGYGYKATSPLQRRTYYSVDDSTTFYDYEFTGRHLLSSELGLMHNLNSNYALGFTHFFGWDVGHHLHGGLKLRLRKWLGEKASLDFSAGPLLWGAGEFDHPAVVGGASLNFNEWESLNLTFTTLQTRPYEYTYFDSEGRRYRNFTPRQRELGIYLGYKFGGKPGLVLNAAALASIAYVLALAVAGGLD